VRRSKKESKRIGRDEKGPAIDSSTREARKRKEHATGGGAHSCARGMGEFTSQSKRAIMGISGKCRIGESKDNTLTARLKEDWRTWGEKVNQHPISQRRAQEKESNAFAVRQVKA